MPVKELSEAAVAALRAATVTEDRVTITTRLDHKVYAKEIKPLLARIGGGGMWNRAQQTHLFPRDPRPELATVLGDGAAPVEMPPDMDKVLSFWRTPDALADRMAALLPPEPGFEAMTEDGDWETGSILHVLEPSAGDGAIAAAVARLGSPAEQWTIRQERTGRSDIAITCIEPDDLRAAELRLRGVRDHRTNWDVRACTFEDYCTTVRGRGLPGVDLFDAVLMNPPFTLPKVGSRARPAAWAEHITRAFGLLRPGGLLVAITPASFQSRTEQRDIALLRATLAQLDEAHVRRHTEVNRLMRANGQDPMPTRPVEHSWEALPDDTFAESGTTVRTGLLIARIPESPLENGAP